MRPSFSDWPLRLEPARIPLVELKAAVMQARKAPAYKGKIPEPLHWDYAEWKRLPQLVHEKARVRRRHEIGRAAEDGDRRRPQTGLHGVLESRPLAAHRGRLRFRRASVSKNSRSWLAQY